MSASYTEKFSTYAGQIHEKLLGVNLRSQLNTTADTISAKIRQGTMEKIPYMLVVGAREAQEQQVVQVHNLEKIKV